ncbi:MAG: trehalose-phosphatase [Peptococcaceae bacterium]|nr:MAG: trehalose-phosphatase [Peptococcaceae bacterium]
MDRILPKLAEKDKIFLFLDYDGTLVPIKPTPAEARPSKKLLALISRLTQRASLKVAVISGRSLDDLFQLLPVGGLYLAGIHGVERYVPPGPPYFIPLPEKARERVAEVAVRLSQKLPSGFLLENKGIALALHYRRAAPEAVPPVKDTFRGFCRALLPCPEWHVIEGKKVIEVRPAEAGKGKVVADFLSRWPGAFPVCLGDDTTDEDAFRFVRDKGLGILVAEKPRLTAAATRLEDPASVELFLRAVLSIFN